MVKLQFLALNAKNHFSIITTALPSAILLPRPLQTDQCTLKTVMVH